MRILITGGAGYIGSRLGLKLCKAGHQVTALDNLRRGTVAAIAGGVRLMEGDVRDERTVRDAVRDAELVYHLAAESAVLSAESDPEYCYSSNVTGTFRVLQAARENGASRVVFSSSREVYGDPEVLPVPESASLAPRNVYGASKAAAEMCCRAFVAKGMEISIARLSNVYGPGDRGRVIPKFVRSAIAGDPLTLFGTEQLMDFVWIDTVVDALARLGNGPHVPEPLNIGSGQGVAILDLARRVVDAAGTDAEVRIAEKRSSEVMRFVADTRAAQASIGLARPADSLFGLPQVIAAAREELLA